MTLAVAMLAGSVVSAVGIVTVLGGNAPPELRMAVWLGMAAPALVASGSWLILERAYRRHPEGLTGLMIAAFAAKVVFFGAYVALIVKGGWVQPVPFALSFSGYFVVLHLTEAFGLRRLFASVFSNS